MNDNDYLEILTALVIAAARRSAQIFSVSCYKFPEKKNHCELCLNEVPKRSFNSLHFRVIFIDGLEKGFHPEKE